MESQIEILQTKIKAMKDFEGNQFREVKDKLDRITEIISKKVEEFLLLNFRIRFIFQGFTFEIKKYVIY